MCKGCPMDHTHLVPNLLVAGVTKTGTTSLYWYLTQHPEVCPPRGPKEIDFFTPMRWGKPPIGTVADYAGYFSACTGQKYRLDASPQYFDGGPTLVETVKRFTPHARVIVMFRDPVHRIWSHYRTLKAKHKLADDVSFGVFFERGMEVYANGQGDYSEFTSYRAASLGCYRDFLQDWLEVFGDDVRVIFYEHLVRDAKRVVTETCAWLGIDPEPAKGFDYTVKNRTIDPRSVRMNSVAYALNRRVGPSLARFPAVKSAVRNAYGLVNQRHNGEELADRDRRMAEEFYLPANAALHAELSRRGYVDLPEWLSSSGSSR